MIDWSFVWSWVAARLTENVVDLVIGAVVILFLFLLIAFRLLWDNRIRAGGETTTITHIVVI